tara:strand:- start:4103 stop:4447 length:345 start_codon:yes stop_codon:yes gene_type:complete
LEEEGIRARDLIEATLVARNRADDPRLRHVGLGCNILDSIEEELGYLLDPELLNHLPPEVLEHHYRSSLRFSINAYYFIKDILDRVVGDLDDYDGNVVCEEWLVGDIIISFHPR